MLFAHLLLLKGLLGLSSDSSLRLSHHLSELVLENLHLAHSLIDALGEHAQSLAESGSQATFSVLDLFLELLLSSGEEVHWGRVLLSFCLEDVLALLVELDGVLLSVLGEVFLFWLLADEGLGVTLGDEEGDGES